LKTVCAEIKLEAKKVRINVVRIFIIGFVSCVSDYLIASLIPWLGSHLNLPNQFVRIFYNPAHCFSEGKPENVERMMKRRVIVLHMGFMR